VILIAEIGKASFKIVEQSPAIGEYIFVYSLQNILPLLAEFYKKSIVYQSLFSSFKPAAFSGNAKLR
ncbi:MAG: hypothetical protein WBV45_04450, partial [Lutimonas sp.]